jgi:hypothetical protein
MLYTPEQLEIQKAAGAFVAGGFAQRYSRACNCDERCVVARGTIKYAEV